MTRVKSPAGILLNLDGEAVDLSEITWYEKAPCGCVSGASIAYSDYGGGTPRIIATADQAAHSHSETKHEREKYERLGFTFFPDLTSKCVELMTHDCPHEPRFGIPKRPEVDGYQWAAVYDAVSRPKLMHLVTDHAIEDAKERRYGSRNAPLCGGKADLWWSTEWHALDGKVECSRCWKKATR